MISDHLTGFLLAFSEQLTTFFFTTTLAHSCFVPRLGYTQITMVMMVMVLMTLH